MFCFNFISAPSGLFFNEFLCEVQGLRCLDVAGNTVQYCKSSAYLDGVTGCEVIDQMHLTNFLCNNLLPVKRIECLVAIKKSIN